MGCGSSKAARVAPMAMEDAPTVEPVKTTKAGDTEKIQVQAAVPPQTKQQPSPTPSRKSMKSLSSSSRAHSGSTSKLSSSKKHGGSNRSLVSLRSEDKLKREQVAKDGSSSSLLKKQNSENKMTTVIVVAPRADSKASMHTEDSGLGSSQHAVIGKIERRVHKDDDESDEGERDPNRPPTPDLTLQGLGIKQRTPGSASGKQRLRQPELKAPDKDTSIIQRPPSRGGMAFEILVATPDTGNTRRPPSRLRALDRTPSTKSRDGSDLTSEQLKQKLLAAEKRRQQYEKENILNKVQTQKERTKEAQTALQAFASRQSQQTEGRLLQKLDQKTENREAHIKALREKLKAKEDHARKVREAKQALAASNA